VTASFLGRGDSATVRNTYGIYDGTDTKGHVSNRADAANEGDAVTVTGTFEYTTAQSSLTFQVYASTGGNVAQIDLGGSSGDNGRLTWTVERFPLDSQKALKIEESSWHIDANIHDTGGGNVSLGTADVSSYSPMADADLLLTQNTGSATAYIPCAVTEVASDTTCSSGSEHIGVSFTIPRAGKYEACFEFSH